MSDTAIRVANLGKRFEIGQGPHHTLRETVTRAMSSPFRSLMSAANGHDAVGADSTTRMSTRRSGSIWVLRDVSFEIKKGETVGIIGPNGSGKSTLLKLLARITEPTEGEIHINGRVTALIELGAGFHPELTGRENIFLNGAILGMTKGEIEAKFAAIVEFAGLSDFLDTPVKHYSSGMAVRLGFALAVSVDPEILLVDEVLAVGDAEFRKRCLDKINTFTAAGKTIVIVTHSLQEVQRIARRALLISNGTIQADDTPDTVIGKYGALVRETAQTRTVSVRENADAPNGGLHIEIQKLQVMGVDGCEKFHFKTHDEFRVAITYVAHYPIVNPMFRVLIYRNDGLLCHGMNTARRRMDLGTIKGEGTIILRYPKLDLLEGDYLIHAAILASQDDELPIHQVRLPTVIRIESKITDGAGVAAMSSEWIILKNVSDGVKLVDG